MFLSILKIRALNKRINFYFLGKCFPNLQSQTLRLSNGYVPKRINLISPTSTIQNLAKVVKRKMSKEEDPESSEEEVPDKKLKAKVVKRKVLKEEDPESSEEEVPDKKPKGKAVKKKVVEKEDPEVQQEEVSEKRPKRNVAKKEKTSEEQPDKDEAPKSKRTAPRAGTSKERKVADKDASASSKKENGAVKKAAKPKKTKDEESEKPKKAPSASEAKKTTGTRAKRGEKPEVEETDEDEEKPVEPAKGRKRKVAPKQDAKTEPETKSTKLVNATSTNWEELDFKCPTEKNSKGNSSNFHITCWNVDGVRAWLKKGGLDILKYDDPDIFCIQETKCSMEKLPEEVQNIEGYETLWCCSDKEGYAGVGIATKVKPLSVVYGIDSEEHDAEGRCITAEFEKFFLVNVYVPNAGRKLVTLPKRLDWNELFKAHIKNLNERKPVIICGDMNVAHTEIDLANPKTNTKSAGFTVEEREGMTELLEEGYIDTFRKLYPDKEKAYTFWTYMSGSRAKNVGWRLDYFVVSEELMEEVCDNVIHKDVFGSDHCPITLHLNV